MCNSRKSINFKVFKIKLIHTASMCKNTTNNSVEQQKTLFSFPEPVFGKKIKVDFNAPDISSNGGLLLARSSKDTLPSKMGRLIPDDRTQCLVRHSYEEMVCQRVNQILCGYEDANDCDRLRGDSALKISVGRRPSDEDLCSQATMTRLENNVDSKTLYKIGKLFAEQYVKSFSKPPRHVILDADDTNANTYGAQQLTLFNAYYNEYCYMPLLIFDGVSKKLILPMLRPGRRNKSLNVSRILRRVVEYLHECWPNTVIELRGDSHFCSHEFMDWAWSKWYVRYLTGLSGNTKLLDMVDKPRRRAENDFKKALEKLHGSDSKDNVVIRRYVKLDYKAQSWKHEQRVIAKSEVSTKGTNIRFVVTKNRNNSPETIYKRYCKRGEMELWIKDVKYFKADRMSCNSYRANYFRLFLYAAAFVVAHTMKHKLFNGTAIENFTMDSFIKRIMLSAVYVVEKKTFVHVSFSPHHRHLEELTVALERLTA